MERSAGTAMLPGLGGVGLRLGGKVPDRSRWRAKQLTLGFGTQNSLEGLAGKTGGSKIPNPGWLGVAYACSAARRAVINTSVSIYERGAGNISRTRNWQSPDLNLMSIHTGGNEVSAR